MDDLDDVFVAQVMSESLYTVTPDTLVEEAANEMMQRQIGSVIVVDDDGTLRGILTNTDFVQIVAERQPKDQTPVSEYMSTDLVTAAPGDSLASVAATMLDHGFHHMPVTDGDDGVVGVVSTTDLTAYLSNIRA
ncbi:CBS domain-containing protein [Halobaculum gomorrense]|uniref:CBS domain-containing protein n=1 Tax=Halobaculum gomorrense TaxID=43928 RepID=A0A1M5L2I9_9EURY|nr:CBS domain-containing protein [Halobaculum gomorrense]SHG59206.1 CBS domain-containing protein [Halobaculum gomorrense]